MRDVDQGVLNQRMEGPGPAHYDVTPVEVTKKGAPAYGLRGKCKSPKNNMQDIPAPNKYKVTTHINLSFTKNMVWFYMKELMYDINLTADCYKILFL